MHCSKLMLVVCKYFCVWLISSKVLHQKKKSEEKNCIKENKIWTAFLVLYFLLCLSVGVASSSLGKPFHCCSYVLQRFPRTQSWSEWIVFFFSESSKKVKTSSAHTEWQIEIFKILFLCLYNHYVIIVYFYLLPKHKNM